MGKQRRSLDHVFKVVLTTSPSVLSAGDVGNSAPLLRLARLPLQLTRLPLRCRQSYSRRHRIPRWREKILRVIPPARNSSTIGYVSDARVLGLPMPAHLPHPAAALKMGPPDAY
jgi:hypothetical protein